MTNLYQPTVTISGQTIAGAWDGAQLVALDQLEITWGRESIYDDAIPSSMALSIIDPDGDWSSNNALVGEPVTVTRLSPDTPMFIGRIADVVLKYVEIWNPFTEQNQHVWVAVLTCTDVLTDLDQIIANSNDQTSTDAWSAIAGSNLSVNNAGSRTGQILKLGAAAVVSSIDGPTVTQVPGTFAPNEAGHSLTEGLSLLDLLTKYYNCFPFSHVNYNPATNGIEIGSSANNDGLALVLVAGVIELVPTSALTIDAREIYSGDLETSSPVASQIDTVIVSYQGVTVSSVHGTYASQRNTSRYVSGSKGSRTYTPNNDWFAGNTNTPIDLYTGNEADAIVAIVNVINSRFHVAGLSYDYRRFGSQGSAIDAVLLDTKSRAQALYFAGSVLNRLRNSGPMFQLIGGKLTWFNKVVGSSLDAGWVVDMNLAPTTGTLLTVLFTALSSNATARIMDFDPELTLNDISRVTTGLT